MHRSWAQYAVMQSCVGLRNALKCSSEAEFTDHVNSTTDSLTAEQYLSCLLLTSRSRLTVFETAGHECKHNTYRADISGCVSG